MTWFMCNRVGEGADECFARDEQLVRLTGLCGQVMGYSRIIHKLVLLSFKCLFKYMQLLVQIGHLLTFG